MKSRIALFTLSILLALVPLVSANDGNRGARLLIASTEHSFGKVKPGTPLTYTFEVKNEGNESLEIKSVQPSCGCTSSNFDKVVAPGKTGRITLEVTKTDGYKGEVTKTATVTTNDPEHQTFTLTLRASFSDE